MRKKLFAALLALALVLLTGIPASALQNTTYTYTMSVNNDWIRTQDAYMPGSIYLKGASLTDPSDIFVHGGKIYVADTANWRVLIYDPATDATQVVGEGVLTSPEGVFVTDDGLLYVADGMGNAVYVFDAQGEVVAKIGRPEKLSADSVYEPRNVVVSSQGYVYVVGTGAYEGLLLFNEKYEFQGYFGTNTRSLSLLEMVQDLLFTEEQSDQLLTRKPMPMENIAISDRDLVYAVTQSEETGRSGGDSNSLKICNFAGSNLLAGETDLVTEANFVDVAVGKDNNFFALTYTGVINEYDETGELLFSFGGRAVSDDRLGMFSRAAAIDVDENGFVYVLDQERGYVQVFYPTDFAVRVHQAMYELNNGRYGESEAIWQQVLQLNGMARVAHIGYGKALLSQRDFKGAMEQFRFANERTYYSEAMWELRNQRLNAMMPFLLGALAVLIVFCYARAMYRRRHPRAVAADSHVVLSREDKTLGKDLAFVFSMLRHPIDGFYYLKHGQRGGPLAATILYLATFVVFAIDRLFRAFLYNISGMQVTSIAVFFFLPAALWVVMSYMISSINDGEGTFKNIYVATAYAFAPYLILSPIVTALTYVLTLNEAFLVQFGWAFAVIWTVVLLVMSVQEIQRYNLSTTLKNIVLTFLLILLAVITCIILYLMLKQLLVFLSGIIREAIYRATL